jgi:hypothetical protein
MQPGFLAEVRDASLAGSAAPMPKAKEWTRLLIVASPRPLVGKTLVARLLIDFLRLNGGRTRAFDLNPGEGTLADLLPAVATRADIGSTQGQMALFDRLIVEGWRSEVIDLGNAPVRAFLPAIGRDRLHAGSAASLDRAGDPLCRMTRIRLRLMPTAGCISVSRTPSSSRCSTTQS